MLVIFNIYGKGIDVLSDIWKISQLLSRLEMADRLC